MPLVRFDILEGKSESDVLNLLDAAHRAISRAFNLSEHDRYQVVSEHPREHMVVQDTGLGIERSDDIVVVSVTSRPRLQMEKLRLYEELCKELEASCGISSSDVVVVITPDWTQGIPGRNF
jgi:hypothetical protein